MRYTPIRYTPIRYTPIRYTPIRYTPIRYTPTVRAAHLSKTILRLHFAQIHVFPWVLIISSKIWWAG